MLAKCQNSCTYLHAEAIHYSENELHYYFPPRRTRSLWSSQRELEYVHNKDVTLCFDRANQVRSS